MTFKTPDLCDQFEAELGKTVRVVAPMFQRYGGRGSFSGEIVTLKVFEDNSLVRQAFAEDGRGKVLVEKQGAAPVELTAKHVILATGARARSLPGLEPDGRLIWSCEAR